MERFSAEAFYNIGTILEGLRTFAQTGLHQIASPELIAKQLKQTQNLLGAMEEGCSSIGLRQTVKAIARARTAISKSSTAEEIAETLTVIDQRLTDEMEDHLFMYIPVARAERYDQEQAFGAEVFKNFPSTTFDIKEGGNCFASARFTACVFHLMRVLEVGLVTFAKLFPSVPTNKENWQQIIEKIESEIRAMPQAATKAPDWKEKMEQYAQTANNFMFFKDAWRNYTAHARGKYTEDEADGIYRNVRGFMQTLAKMGLHE